MCGNPYITLSPPFLMQTILGTQKVRLKAQYNHYIIVTITTYTIQLVLVYLEDTVFAMEVVLLGQ